MIPKVNSGSFQGQVGYYQPANQAVWRQEMLEQVLQKVREVQPVVQKSVQVQRPVVPAKGSLVDFFA
jgi:hypothetical protein